IGVGRQLRRKVSNAFIDIVAFIRRKELPADIAEHGWYVDAEVSSDEIVRLWLHATEKIVQLSQSKKALKPGRIGNEVSGSVQTPNHVLRIEIRGEVFAPNGKRKTVIDAFGDRCDLSGSFVH